jgi:hypothetical protein
MFSKLLELCISPRLVKLLHVDDDNDHVATMTSKGRRLAGLCRRKLVSRNPAFMMKVFNTYLLPSMLYASSVWSPRLRYELNALETIQRQYTRRIVGLRHMCYGERLHTMQQLSIESTFMASDLVLAYKLLHGKLGITAADAGLNLCAGTTRANGILLQQQHGIPMLWKTVPLDILQSPSLSLFKKKLKKWLLAADFMHFD